MKTRHIPLSWVLLLCFFFSMASVKAQTTLPDNNQETELTDTVKTAKWYTPTTKHPKKGQDRSPGDTLSILAALDSSFSMMLTAIKPASTKATLQLADSLSAVLMVQDTVKTNLWNGIKYRIKALQDETKPTGPAWLSLFFPLLLGLCLIYALVVLLKLYVFRQKIDS
ncbi:MAG: hypothetical protein GXY09_07910 [Bacteroidales bacterium]|nr:hypothetical protein [Bacteroidales bacterium]